MRRGFGAAYEGGPRRLGPPYQLILLTNTALLQASHEASFPRLPVASCSVTPPRYNNLMTTISIQEMQRDPLGCLQRVEDGETLLVLRDQRPVAEIKPVPTVTPQPRPYGLCAGQFTVPEDFDRPLPDDVLKDFEGP